MLKKIMTRLEMKHMINDRLRLVEVMRIQILSSGMDMLLSKTCKGIHHPVRQLCTSLPQKNIASRSTGEMSRSWKNSEEEEYMWGNLNHGVSKYVPADSKQKDHWDGDDLDKLKFAGHLTRQSETEVGLGSDRKNYSLSSEEMHIGHQRSSSWQLREELSLHGSDNSLPRTSFKSDVVPAQAKIPSFGHPTGAVSGPFGSVGKQHPSSGKPLVSQQSSCLHHLCEILA